MAAYPPPAIRSLGRPLTRATLTAPRHVGTLRRRGRRRVGLANAGARGEDRKVSPLRSNRRPPLSSIPIPQTSVLDAFQVELLSALQPYMEDVEFEKGDVIYERGKTADAFYIVD